MALSFHGQTVIVTGAGGSIGRAHALAYGERGANVVVNDLNGDAAARVVQEIIAAGGKAVADSHSVTDGAAVVRTALDAFGGLHILINNAGIIVFSDLERFTDKQWDDLVNVNLRGTISCTQAAWPIFRNQKFGRIVNTTSAAGLYGFPPDCVYSAAKSGVIAFTKTSAEDSEGKGFNIKVNAIAPASDSAMSRDFVSQDVLRTMPPHVIPPLILALTHEKLGPDVNGSLFENFSGWMAEVRSTKPKGLQLRVGEPLSPSAIRDSWASVAPDFATHISPHEEDLRFYGQTVIVTGAMTVDGRAYATALGQLGANVVVADSDEAHVSQLVQQIIVEGGGKAMGLVTSGTATDALVQRVVEAYGAVHALVTFPNSLPNDGAELQQIGDKTWDDALGANGSPEQRLRKFVRACWPVFKRQNYGRVVLTSSTAGIYGNAGNAAFSASTGTLIGLARAISNGSESHGIYVNVLAPLDGGLSDAAAATSVATLLASKANAGVNGAVIEVDGVSVRQFHWERSGGHTFDPDEQFTPEAVISQWTRVTAFDDERVSYPSKIGETMSRMGVNNAQE